jgi:hypothetical protein
VQQNNYASGVLARSALGTKATWWLGRLARVTAGLALVSAVVPVAASAAGNVNEGAGKLRLGQTVQRVIRLTNDRPAQVVVRANGAVKALAFIGSHRAPTTVIAFSLRERACQIIIQSPGLKTDLGHIGVRSTKQAVLSAFGTSGRWLGPEPHLYSVLGTAANGDTIGNLFGFNRAGRVQTIAITDKTTSRGAGLLARTR